MINFYTPFKFPIHFTAPMLVVPTINQPSQPSLTEQSNQVSFVNQGTLVLLLFLSYIVISCIGLKYKKYKEKQAVCQQDQLKTLERMWNLPAHKSKINSREH